MLIAVQVLLHWCLEALSQGMAFGIKQLKQQIEGIRAAG